jgi:hypothetical protein
VVEAADALACAQADPSYAVTAKSKRGQLLETTGGLYGRLFTRELTAHGVWYHVAVLRAVDAELDSAQRNLQGRPKTVAVQGNRLIAHLVFAKLRASSELSEDERLAQVPATTCEMLHRVIRHVEADFADSYVTSLFKNTTKCRQITSAVLAELLADNPAHSPAT